MSYKTMFVDAPLIKEKQGIGVHLMVVNGDQFARDIDAAVHEKAREGYELMNSMPIESSKSVMGSYTYNFTSGIMLIFKKEGT